jgi:glycosyltransferase involved in cell wall biosynthesis
MNMMKYSFEIIFVDDKSPDNSSGVIDEIISENPSLDLLKITNKENMGRGRSIAIGFTKARGNMIGFLDIDLEVHPRYILPALMEIEKGADFVLTARTFELTYHGLTRFVLSKGYIRFSSRMLGTKGIDSEAGFKFFNKSKMMDIIMSVEDGRWFWDTELVYRARRAGKKIVEVPALFTRSSDKKSTVHIVRDTWRYCVKLAQFKRRIKKITF